MNISIDILQLLKNYESVKQKLNTITPGKSITNLTEAQDCIAILDSELKTLVDILDNLIKTIDPLTNNNLHSKQPKKSEKFNLETLQALYSASEEDLKRAKLEIKQLRNDINRLEKSQGDNNLFTVEVYQTEIEELKKDYSEKISELQSKF